MSADELQSAPAPSNVTETPPASQPAGPEAVVDRPTVALAPLSAPPRLDQDRPPRFSVFEGVLIALAALLAFELASFAVRNHDLLIHMAAGRDLLQGKYNPFAGQEPYSFTSATWVNHSWLYGVVTYLLHEVVGVPGLIVLKALLIVGLALILVRVGRAGNNLWGATLAVTLGVVVISQRLLLQPAVLSLLFLGLTLYFLQRGGRWLWRPGQEEVPAGVSWKDYWPLLPLFFLWVNLDEWFFLGPLTVAMYSAGQALQALQRGPDATAPRAGESKALATILVAGLGVCLLNPMHVFAFTLPPQLGLSGTASLLREEASFRPSFQMVFDPVFFQKNQISASHLAYFVLVASTLLSFGVNFRGFRFWRGLLAGVFVALSVYHQRAAPFFAVVAAPIMALNFQEAVLRYAQPGRRRDPLVELGRAFTFLALLLLLPAGYVGWLHARSADRRVSFANELDPALKETAEYLNGLLDNPKVGATELRGFHFSPDITNALAWYSPRVKGFFDHRYAVYGKETTRDFLAVRRGLLTDQRTPGRDQEDWREILRQHNIDHVVLYAPDPRVLQNAMTLLTTDPPDRPDRDWVLLLMNSHAAVFGNARARPAFAALAVNFEQELYAPKQDGASDTGLSRVPAEQPFWAVFTDPPPSRTPGADEAMMHLARFNSRRREFDEDNQRSLQIQLAAQAMANFGSAPTLPQLATALIPLRLCLGFAELMQRLKAVGTLPLDQLTQEQKDGLRLFERYQEKQNFGPPEHLLLAVRSARRGLDSHPNDAIAHLRLGTAYSRLPLLTRERQYSEQVLPRLRHVQAVAALQSALLYHNDPAVAHEALADLYAGLADRGDRRHGYMDIELVHRKAALKYTRAAGRPSGEKEKQFKDRLAGMQKEVDQLEKFVEDQSAKFENMRRRLTRVSTRAQEALKMNLAGKALEELLKSDAAGIGPEGTLMQLELGLMTGRLRDVKYWFDDTGEHDTKDEDGKARPGLRSRLGKVGFCQLRAMLAAGMGDYATADKMLQELADQYLASAGITESVYRAVVYRLPKEKSMPQLSAEQAVALLVTKSFGDSLLFADMSWFTFVSRLRGLGRLTDPPALIRETYSILWESIARASEHHYCRGLLALEQGDIRRAEEAFGQVDKLSNTLRGFQPSGPLLPLQSSAREHLEKINKYR